MALRKENERRTIYEFNIKFEKYFLGDLYEIYTCLSV